MLVGGSGSSGVFVSWWVGVTVVGWVVGFAICEAFFTNLTFPGTTTEGAVIGTFVGIGQALLLRGRIGGAVAWVVATIVSFGIGKALGQLVGGPLDTPLSYAVVGAFIGSFVGAAQWFVLRSRVPRAGWWIVASLAGWGVGWLFVAYANQADDSAVLITYALGAIGAAAAGVITGLTFVRLAPATPR